MPAEGCEAETIVRTQASGLTGERTFVATAALLWLAMMWMEMPGQRRLDTAGGHRLRPA
jgi:hypothetical protein